MSNKNNNRFSQDPVWGRCNTRRSVIFFYLINTKLSRISLINLNIYKKKEYIYIERRRVYQVNYMINLKFFWRYIK